MWPKNRVTELLQIEVPIIQAPMAGGPTTPELVAAVSNAGGLGSLGAGYLPPEQIREAVREIQKRTDRPFAVNLFVPQPVSVPAEQAERMNRLLQPVRSELGIGMPPAVTKYEESFEQQLAVVLEERVPVFSFTFGIPAPEQIRELKANQTTVIGTATTVREAVELEAAGVDLIVGQGSEAGGHRGTFRAPFEQALVGTMALIPQLVDHVRVPVIAAGGIMDGRGVVAALVLGACGVQMGTVFLASTESGAHPVYKQAVLDSTDESTVITRAFSGKPARGIKNRFIGQVEPYADEIPEYPVQNALTRDIRQAAARQNRPEYMSLWAGQASRLSRSKPAGDLLADIISQVEEVLGRIRTV